MYRYIDGVFSIHYPDFEKYLDQIYIFEIEIKATKECKISNFI